MWIQWLFAKTWTKGQWPPRWPLTPHLLRSHVWLYPRIILSKSHENTSKYVDTVNLFAKTWTHTTYDLHLLQTHTYTCYVQNQWSHSLFLNFVQARQKLLIKSTTMSKATMDTYGMSTFITYKQNVTTYEWIRENYQVKQFKIMKFQIFTSVYGSLIITYNETCGRLVDFRMCTLFIFEWPPQVFTMIKRFYGWSPYQLLLSSVEQKIRWPWMFDSVWSLVVLECLWRYKIQCPKIHHFLESTFIHYYIMLSKAS